MRLTISISLLFVVVALISDFQPTESVSIGHSRRPRPHKISRAPPQPILRRRGHGSGSAEEESDEDDNESQARVEPQITPLNRDECLAKLLCGMSVPVTGGGAPKNGYYSEYANIVAKFFQAFPLEEEEKSVESLEAYDDYSAEEVSKPVRVTSKVPTIEAERSPDKSPVSEGLQLIDLPSAKEATNASSNPTDDDEKTARSIDLRVARARRMVAKLGEKLQTVRQCQQISGCPFTFKQLRSKLKAAPSSVNSNVPLGSAGPNPFPVADFDLVPPVKYTYNTNSYKPVTKDRPKPASTEVTLGKPVEPYKDTNKGDDELEELFGPPPVFGANGRPASDGKLTFQQFMAMKGYKIPQDFVPYNPGKVNVKAKVQSGQPFPKRKVQYKIPSFVKGKPTADNDEFDDVNKSTGPIALIGGDDGQFPKKKDPEYIIIDETKKTKNPEKENEAEDDNSEEGSEEEDETADDGEGDYEDEEEDAEEEDADVESGEAEDEEETVDEASAEDSSSSKKKETTKEAEKPVEESSSQKKKIKYKKPPKEGIVVIEEEFPEKTNTEDDEAANPDNAWAKFTYLASGAQIKEPKYRNKSELEEKNDEKLNLSKETSKEEEEEDEESSTELEDEDAEDDDGETKSRSQVKAKKVVKTKKEKSDAHDDEVEEENSRKRRPAKKTKPKITLDDEDEFESLPKVNKGDNAHSKIKKTKKNGSQSSAHKTEKKNKKKKEKKPESIEDDRSEEDERDDSPRKPPPLMQIGGRPIAPPPQAEKPAKAAGALSRFKFSLVRPQGAPTNGEQQASVYQQSAQIPSLPKPSFYQKPTLSPASNSFRVESIGTKFSSNKNQESYASSNYHHGPSNSGGNNKTPFSEVPGNPGPPSATNAKPPSVYSFPFGGPLSTLKTLFRRPGSGSHRQELPGPQNHNAPPPPVSAFMYRPIGPESHEFKRNDQDKLRSGLEKSSKKAKKSNKGRSGITNKPSKKNSTKKSKKGYKLKPKTAH